MSAALETRPPAGERVYTVRLRQPHPKQAEFIDSPAKRKVVRAGRRGGKTVGVAVLAVKAFLDGHRVLYAVPTQEQVDAFWFEVKRALHEPIEAELYIKNEGMHTITRPGTRQRIRAKTAFNADTLRGDYADVLILDELQLMSETAWEDVGAPMLLDNDGDAVFIYTPPSRKSRALSRATDPRYAAKMYKRAAADTSGRWAAFHFTSHENPYISEQALADIAAEMTTEAHGHEILAQDDEDIPGALWKRAEIDAARVLTAPEMRRVVVTVDPTCSKAGDEAGITVTGLGVDGHGYLLADGSLHGSPGEWARIAVLLFDQWHASEILYETNQGGEMVEHTIVSTFREMGRGRYSIPLRGIPSVKGKMVRAEYVAAQAQHRRIHHIGTFAQLEEELCSYTGAVNEASPNRLDSYVIGMTDLLRNKPNLAGMDRAALGF